MPVDTCANTKESFIFVKLSLSLIARQSNPTRLQRFSLTSSVNPIESILQLVLLGTAGDLGELGLRDAGHEPLQAAESLGHLLIELVKTFHSQ